MLKARFFMNSSMEEILAKKCCGLWDQNLEVHVENAGPKEVFIHSRLTLLGGGPDLVIKNLYPPGGWTLAPGRTGAFYCYLDPVLWKKYQAVVLMDGQGKRHRFPIRDQGA
ncbi:MAG: hypothetical protein JRI97_03045 [Deltaproteobacteria bacterium]|nr:hypothetical protein [Deltaproteobacteria bacterium]